MADLLPAQQMPAVLIDLGSLYSRLGSFQDAFCAGVIRTPMHLATSILKAVSNGVVVIVSKAPIEIADGSTGLVKEAL